GGRRAQHGIDELREVLGQAPGLRVQVRLRQPLRRDHRAARGDAPTRHQARARVLRPRPRGVAGAARRHGPARAAAPRGLRDGRRRGRARHRSEHRRDGRQPRGCPSVPPLGGYRDRPGPVDAGRRRADARRIGAGRSRGQLLPPERRDGSVQWRSDCPGAADDRGGGAAAGDGRRGAGITGDPPTHHTAGGPMTLALDGLRVLDLTRLLPGGYCSLLMADFGAEVIKVEDMGMGDYIRWSPPYYEGADETARSAMFLALNRGKRSVRVDLKNDRGREVMLRLVRDADVLLESFRPGVLDRLGVGWERLQAVNPRLIYCAITGYRQDGPHRDRSG